MSVDTKDNILDIAQHLTQIHGLGGFSYRDISNKLGIKTSSIHYHFPTKQDLAFMMIDRYLEEYRLLLQEIDLSNSTCFTKLKAFCNIFVATAVQGKFCLCGMLASELPIISEKVKGCLQEFFGISEKWLAEAIKLGQERKEFNYHLDSEQEATHLLALLEGGMLISPVRSQGYLEELIDIALKNLASRAGLQTEK